VSSHSHNTVLRGQLRFFLLEIRLLRNRLRLMGEVCRVFYPTKTGADLVLGWGNGFLGTLRNGATGINYGHNGATTKSFVDRGDW